ncbi:MAG: hypothetical protein WAU07_01060 [Microgenomates group bacterium]
MHPKIERVLRQVILKDLDFGRGNYDRQHTEAVVHWMKYLLEHEPLCAELDSSVLVTTAYAHDWGWSGVFTNSNPTFQEVIDKKSLHMKISAERISTLLYSKLVPYFSEKQRLRIIHLVENHDRINFLQDADEFTLLEADTLGMLDSSRVKSTLTPSENERFMKNSIYTKRLPRFIHSTATRVANELIEKRDPNYIAVASGP